MRVPYLEILPFPEAQAKYDGLIAWRGVGAAEENAALVRISQTNMLQGVVCSTKARDRRQNTPRGSTVLLE